MSGHNTARCLCASTHICIEPLNWRCDMERDRQGEGSQRGDRERRYAFGRQVLTLRTQVALTQSALAAAVGVHRRSVQKWETGQSYPKAETLQRLLAVFLQQHAFTPGNERAEAHALWSQAAQDGPHALAAFDDAWFDRTLASSGASAPSVPPATGPALPAFLAAAPPQRGTAPPFVVREQELAELTAALTTASRGVGQILFVIGGAGRGKTMLVQEFARQAQAAHAELLVGR